MRLEHAPRRTWGRGAPVSKPVPLTCALLQARNATQVDGTSHERSMRVLDCVQVQLLHAWLSVGSTNSQSGCKMHQLHACLAHSEHTPVNRTSLKGSGPS